MVVHKKQIEFKHEQSLPLTGVIAILDIKLMHINKWYIWYLVDTANIKATIVNLTCVGTGDNVDVTAESHVVTVHDEPFLWHWFAEIDTIK